MMGHREKITASEFDAFTHGGRSWRNMLVWARHELRKIKRSFNRRVRRTYKVDSEG
jgi:hypothetical protein